MLLFQKRFHEGLLSGAVTLTFRAWDKPHVKAGGRYRCHPIGVLEVARVDRVRLADVTDAEAVRAGFDSRDDLLAMLRSVAKRGLGPDASVFRVELHHAGDGDRVEGALDTDLDASGVADLEERLARLDAKGPWTTKTLDLILQNPRVAASRLAKEVGRETAPFKADVVRLKRLGLTQSFEVGYEVSPRGLAFLKARKAKRPGGKRRAGGPGARG